MDNIDDNTNNKIIDSPVISALAAYFVKEGYIETMSTDYITPDPFKLIVEAA